MRCHVVNYESQFWGRFLFVKIGPTMSKRKGEQPGVKKAITGEDKQISSFKSFWLNSIDANLEAESKDLHSRTLCYYQRVLQVTGGDPVPIIFLTKLTWGCKNGLIFLF